MAILMILNLFKQILIFNLKIFIMRKWTQPQLLFSVLILFISCDREPEIPPTLELKTGTGYTSQDAIISKDSTLTVGIIATKTEDDLKTYNVSVSYDGASSTFTVENFTLTSGEKSHYDKDVTFTVRDLAGLEKYYFTITDVDGNIVQKSLSFTVE
jgi:hypothetical protein